MNFSREEYEQETGRQRVFSSKLILCSRLDLAQERSSIHEAMTFKISKTRRRKGRWRKDRRRKERRRKDRRRKGRRRKGRCDCFMVG